MSFNSPTSLPFSLRPLNFLNCSLPFSHSSVAACLLAPIHIMHFSNLLVLASTAVLAVAAPSTGLKKRVKTFKFFGVNESGAEFGNTAIPGQLGKDYTWPLTYVFLYLLSCSQLINITFRTTIDTLVGKGLNIFRKSFPISKRLN
jgi:hypothetical protein